MLPFYFKEKNMKVLEKLIAQLENAIPNYTLVNTAVSAGSVGWHIEHTLLTYQLIIDNVQKSDPSNYKWTFNFIRTLVFLRKKIPRGKAKSPKQVRPTDGFNDTSLKRSIVVVKEKVALINGLQKNNYFDHPFFGKLNVAATVQFLAIHTQHHLNIINDIVKSKPAN